MWRKKIVRNGYPFILSLILATSYLITFVNAQESDKAPCLSCQIPDPQKFDCFPEKIVATQSKCYARGCCWAPIPGQKNDKNGIPFCYYPIGYSNYTTVKVEPLPNGYIEYIEKPTPLPHLPGDKLSLKVIVEILSDNLVRMRILDPNEARWEVPLPLNKPPPQSHIKPKYKILPTYVGSLFNFRVLDKETGSTTFKIPLEGPLIYSDQFIQFSAMLPSKYVYGIGERQGPLLQNIDWNVISLYARDTFPEVDKNLYGVHNFFLGMMENGMSYGLFMLNSNAQEVTLQPAPAITLRTIGGVLDMFFFLLRDDPKTVLKDYWSLVGPPMLPPYWSLGFHMCRWGYSDLNHVRDVFLSNVKLNIPQDVQWVDIDYMDRYLDWTTDPKHYNEIGNFVDELHERYDARFIVIVDPGISNQYPGQYAPYDEGLLEGVYINHTDRDEPIIGTVWPGTTVYPDFSNPRTLKWWTKHMAKFHQEKVAFDGLWIDMNEPSNFVNGEMRGCPNTKWDNPPYIPSILDGDLKVKTICPSFRQVVGRLYDTHNLYGYFEAQMTHAAMQNLFGPRKRLFILSRSTFAGSGRYTFHWSGDINSDWDNLYYSIVQMMNFNFFAMPMFGADICGFTGDTNEELCVRWHQAGAFYPFMRNHNALGQKAQEPSVWSAEGQRRIRDAIRMRYSLLPYLYTLLHRASTENETVVRPLFLNFPTLPEVFSIDTEFMWGEGLLIAPVLQGGAVVAREIMFPQENNWCSLPDLMTYFYPIGVKNISISMDSIPVYIRGGYIITTQGWGNTAPLNATTTGQYRQLPITLLVCADSHDGSSTGEMIWDDGETYDTVDKGIYNLMTAKLTQDGTGQGKLIVSTPYARLPSAYSQQSLGQVIVMGVMGSGPPHQVMVNGEEISTYEFNLKAARLNIELSDLPIVWSDISITWK